MAAACRACSSRTDETLGRDIVVKVLTPALVSGVSAERFTREIRVAARLQHPNVVPVLAAGAGPDGLPFYTMPYIDGATLHERIVAGAVGLPEALAILRDIARALAYAHGQGIVHRDVKPANVLLSSGAAMVTDFGIAKALAVSTHELPGEVVMPATSETLTRVGTSLGTPAYMAPEQAVGEQVDARADVYAWGVVAWELLAGRHPFGTGMAPQRMIAAHLSLPAPSLVDAVGGRGAHAGRNAARFHSLAALVMRALAKEPDARPADGGALVRAPEAIDTSDREEEHRARQPARARRATWVLPIAATVALLAAGGVWWRSQVAASGFSSESLTPAASRAVNGAESPSGPSLAILPFQPLGNDTANAYFAEGIADEVATALSRVPGLRIAGRNSAARFRGARASAQEVGSALAVSAVLSGSVRRAGSRVRVTAELASARDGSVMWQDGFERSVADVFAVQDELATAIAGALRVRLAADETGGRRSQGTDDLEAYDLYLRGLQLYRLRGPGLVEAERVLVRAIARDPRFARVRAPRVGTPRAAVLPRRAHGRGAAARSRCGAGIGAPHADAHRRSRCVGARAH